jgi:hypothetical protein
LYVLLYDKFRIITSVERFSVFFEKFLLFGRRQDDDAFGIVTVPGLLVYPPYLIKIWLILQDSINFQTLLSITKIICSRHKHPRIETRLTTLVIPTIRQRINCSFILVYNVLISGDVVIPLVVAKEVLTNNSLQVPVGDFSEEEGDVLIEADDIFDDFTALLFGVAFHVIVVHGLGCHFQDCASGKLAGLVICVYDAICVDWNRLIVG